MGSRVPVEHYDLRAAASSFIGATLHDLNSGDDVADDNDDRSSGGVTDCMDETYRASPLPLQCIGLENDRSSLENNGSSGGAFPILTVEDISPIETARARFLDFVVNHFIKPHMIEVSDYEGDYLASKRKSEEIRYEGDARYSLPLMYVANLYETLVNEINMRLSSVTSMHERTIGVALEAAGGLYRKLAKNFPRKGPCTFKRRELATSFETRSRYPELVIQEEKRVRFVVVNGLSIVDKPTKIDVEDAEWFKRLTGRNEIAVSAGDYKFYSPRHKYRRPMSNSISNIADLPTFPSPENSSPADTSQGYQPVNDVVFKKFPCRLCRLVLPINPSIGLTTNHLFHHALMLSRLPQNIIFNNSRTRFNTILHPRVYPNISARVLMHIISFTANSMFHHLNCLKSLITSSHHQALKMLLAYSLLVMLQGVCIRQALRSSVMNVVFLT